ncbi:hypothetical protein HMPREF0742_00234 [Rothia aeria F0184]|uniref:Uncharacterized protein n=1 Tax=Rothia aeria F0184 TaxID=888019 RepID=U7V859_9MICC|nr:hypothetical protein HMPREF0742_00234 [Rothia aeria F0184]
MLTPKSIRNHQVRENLSAPSSSAYLFFTGSKILRFLNALE